MLIILLTIPVNFPTRRNFRFCLSSEGENIFRFCLVKFSQFSYVIPISGISKIKVICCQPPLRNVNISGNLHISSSKAFLPNQAIFDFFLALNQVGTLQVPFEVRFRPIMDNFQQFSNVSLLGNQQICSETFFANLPYVT